MGQISPILKQKYVLTAKEKKGPLRNDILQKRLKLPFEEIFGLSSAIQKRFSLLTEFKHAKRMALYASFKNEVLTDDIIKQALADGKEVFFPRVIRDSRGSRGLVFLKINGKNDLVQGSYEIQEPAHNKGTEIGAISSFNIIVLPGIAFDKNGNRLGYGKGYYDRMLGGIKDRCLIVALAFDFQILDEIPAETHDMKMDRIITESRVINTVKISRPQGWVS